jgi:AcrR family transcriptional regulator
MATASSKTGKAPSAGERSLSTAEKRREELIDAAIPVFAEKGYHAAPTKQIAERAGISQAYLFRLFPTKEDLFVAVCERSCEVMYGSFAAAADQAEKEGRDPLEVMGEAYADLVADNRDMLLIQLHAQAVSPSLPAVRDTMRRCFATLFAVASERSRATPEELKLWMAGGMLINVMTAIGANQVEEPWARTLADFEGDCDFTPPDLLDNSR